MQINPVQFAHSVCDEFLRYIFSEFPLSDPRNGSTGADCRDDAITRLDSEGVVEECIAKAVDGSQGAMDGEDDGVSFEWRHDSPEPKKGGCSDD